MRALVCASTVTQHAKSYLKIRVGSGPSNLRFSFLLIGGFDVSFPLSSLAMTTGSNRACARFFNRMPLNLNGVSGIVRRKPELPYFLKAGLITRELRLSFE